MDPADPDALCRLLQPQEERLQRQEESLSMLRHEWRAMSEQQGGLLSAFGSQMNFLVDQVQRLQKPVSSGDTGADSVPQTSAAAPSSPLSGSSPHLQLSRPERFSGDSGDCRSFLTQCELHFEFQASSFPSDRAKIAFIMSHLSGRALDWATAEWNRRAETCNSLRLFTKTFSQIFQTVSPGREAARKLVALHQNRRRVMDYAIEFRTLAAESGWNEAALSDAFLHGLSKSIKDHLAPLDLPAGSILSSPWQSKLMIDCTNGSESGPEASARLLSPIQLHAPGFLLFLPQFLRLPLCQPRNPCNSAELGSLRRSGNDA